MRLGEPYTFFVDRSLGSGLVAKALRQQNEKVVVHDEHFRQHDTADVVWLHEARVDGSFSRKMPASEPTSSSVPHCLLRMWRRSCWGAGTSGGRKWRVHSSSRFPG